VRITRFLKIVFLPFLSPSIEKRIKILFTIALFFPLIIAVPSYLLSYIISFSFPNPIFLFTLWFIVFYTISWLYMVFINNLLEIKKQRGYSYSIKKILLNILKFKYGDVNDIILLFSLLLIIVYAYLIIFPFYNPLKNLDTALLILIYMGLFFATSILFFGFLLFFIGLQERKTTIISLVLSFSAILFIPSTISLIPLAIKSYKSYLSIILGLIISAILPPLMQRLYPKRFVFTRKEKWSLFFDGRLIFLHIPIYFALFLSILMIFSALKMFVEQKIFLVGVFLISIVTSLIISFFILLAFSFLFFKCDPEIMLSFFDSWRKFFECYHHGKYTNTINDYHLNKLVKIAGKCVGISFNETYKDYYSLFEQSFWLELRDGDGIIEIIKLESFFYKKLVQEGDTIMVIGFPRKIYDEQEKNFRYIIEAHYIESQPTK